MMTTDDLIARLSIHTAPAPLRTDRLGWAIALSIGAPVMLFVWLMGTRPDLTLGWQSPVVPFKTILPLITCALSLRLVLRLARPGARVGLAAWLYVIPALVALVLWAYAFASRAPLVRFAEVSAASLGQCLGLILLLSFVPAVVILSILRQGASTSPLLSGALAGLTAATGAAAGYSLYCTRDNPLFFVTWYGAAILLVTLISAAFGRRMLVW